MSKTDAEVFFNEISKNAKPNKNLRTLKEKIESMKDCETKRKLLADLEKKTKQVVKND